MDGPSDHTLRIGAARQLGWSLRKPSHAFSSFDYGIAATWYDSAGRFMMQYRSWNPHTDRNDLARVFCAVRERIPRLDITLGDKPMGDGNDRVLSGLWCVACATPREALIRLLATFPNH